MSILIDWKILDRLRRKKPRPKRSKASAKSSATAERELKQRLSELWKKVLHPASERLQQMIRDGASPTEIANFMEATLRQAEFEYGFDSKRIVVDWQLAVDRDTRIYMTQALKSSLGVDIKAFVDDPVVKDALKLGSHEAANLITSIPREYLGEVARSISDAFLGKELPEGRNLIEQIQHIGGVSRKRAKLIARDQTNKLIGSLNKARQESIGIKMYVWRTAGDQRVVGNPAGRYPEPRKLHGDHFHMNHMYCRWDNSNIYSKDKGKTWIEREDFMKGAIPGSQIQCRCWQQPVVDIDEILKFTDGI